MSRPIITAEQFDDIVANHCSRWAINSLAIARALIVDGTQLSEVAKQHECTTQYANVVRARFYTKAQKVRVSLFKQGFSLPVLEPYKSDIKTLKDDGYTLSQVVKYLAQNNVAVSVSDVRKYLEGEA